LLSEKTLSSSNQSPSRSGAFDGDVDRRVEKFTESIDIDRQLFRQDIAGSVAHAQMLADQKVLTTGSCCDPNWKTST